MQVPKARILVGILVTVLALTPLCFGAQASTEKTTMKDVKREAADTAQAIKKYSAEQRDEAMKQAQAALKDLDARIDSMEARLDEQWEQMNQNARQKSRVTLEALRAQRNKVAEWYGGLQYGSANAWEEMKKGFADAYMALHEAWEKAQKELASDQ